MLQSKSSQVSFHVARQEPGIQDYRLAWAFSKHTPGVMLGTTWKTAHLTILRISSHQTSRFYDYHTIVFRILASFSVIRGLEIVALPWMLDLWSFRRTVFVEIGSSRWIMSFAVTFAAGVLWLLDAVLFNVQRSLSLRFVFRSLFPLSWWCLTVICVCRHNLGNCCPWQT